MIVTTGTPGRQTEESDACGRDHVVQFVIPGGLELGLGQLRWEGSATQKTGRHPCHRLLRCQFVSGQLPADEVVIRQILIEGLDQKIAVMKSRGAIVILLVPMAFGEASHVHPVPSPAVAIMRAGEQVIDQLAPSLGVDAISGGQGRRSRILTARQSHHPTFQLLGRRGQTEQVEPGSPNQDSRRREGIGMRTRFLLSRNHELIDRGPRPTGLVHWREGLLQRPE